MDITSKKSEDKIYQIYEPITDPKLIELLDFIVSQPGGGTKGSSYYIINTLIQVHHPNYQQESVKLMYVVTFCLNQGFKYLMYRFEKA